MLRRWPSSDLRWWRAAAGACAGCTGQQRICGIKTNRLFFWKYRTLQFGTKIRYNETKYSYILESCSPNTNKWILNEGIPNSELRHRFGAKKEHNTANNPIFDFGKKIPFATFFPCCLPINIFPSTEFCRTDTEKGSLPFSFCFFKTNP